MSERRKRLARAVLVAMMAIVAFMHVGLAISRIADQPAPEPFNLDRWSRVRWRLPANRIYRVQHGPTMKSQRYRLLLPPRHVDQDSDSPWVLWDASPDGARPKEADVVQDLGDGFFLLHEEPTP